MGEDRKYELTNETKNNNNGHILHRIRSLRSFGAGPHKVEEGEMGGYVQSEKNLSHEGAAWVSGDAQVVEDALVSGNARVFGNAQVSGNAWLLDEAQVSENARVSGNAQVSGKAWVFGEAHLADEAQVFGNNQVSGDVHVSGKWTGKIISDGTSPANQAPSHASDPFAGYQSRIETNAREESGIKVNDRGR